MATQYRMSHLHLLLNVLFALFSLFLKGATYMKFIIITINIIIIFWVKASLSHLRFSFLLPTFTLTAPDLCTGVSPVKRLTD